MPLADIEVPMPGATLQVDLAYLDHGGTTDIGYLQRVRSMAAARGPTLARIEQRYHRMLPFWAPQLAVLIQAPVSAILSPPSSRPNLAAPYRLALTARFPEAVDLTGRFARPGTERAGEGATVHELIAATTYAVQGDESTFGVIVIVDDVVEAAKTVAASITLLRAAGVRADADFRVAAPLWLG